MKTTKEIARELGLLRRRSSSCQHARDVRKAQTCTQEFSFLIVIDFESTCWKEKEMNTCQEIIEFPAVLLNTSTGVIVDEFHSYVLPMEHPQLSKFCTEFTGITQDMVSSGAPLSVILSQFLKWLKKLATEHNIDYHTAKDNKKLCTFVTWSDWDLGLCLHRECLRKQIFKPLVLESWIDLRATYKKFYQRKPNGLNGALQDVGIKFTGREHSGLDDARNTAQLAWKMICDSCQMSLTKTHNRGSGSGSLMKPSAASCLSNETASPHQENIKIGQCIKKPSTFARPSTDPNSENYGCNIQVPSTSTKASNSLQDHRTSSPSITPHKQVSAIRHLSSLESAGSLKKPIAHLHGPSSLVDLQDQNQNTSVGKYVQNPAITPKNSSSVGLQLKKTSLSEIQNSGTSLLRRPTESINSLNGHLRTGISTNFKMPLDRGISKETRLVNNRNMGISLGVTKDEDKPSRINQHDPSLEKSKKDFEDEIDKYQDEVIDLNTCFIEQENDKENIINNNEKKQLAPDKSFTSLKKPMKTPNTKVHIFNVHKIHNEFKPPQKHNSIRNYLNCRRKSIGTLTNNATSLVNDHQKSSKSTGCAIDANDSAAVSSPTWITKKETNVGCCTTNINFTTPTCTSHSSIKKKLVRTNTNTVHCGIVTTTPTFINNTADVTTPKCNTSRPLTEKITPPMCQCGRRTKRKIASKPGPNQNSPFFVCPKSNGYRSKEKSGCGYFQWESNVIKKNQNLFVKNKNLTSRLSMGYGSAIQIGTTPVNDNFKSFIGRNQILKQSLRTAFRNKPY